MKISVVIPTYNRAYIVRDALESALRQSYRDFEIIVVDDGSTDHTREIIESLGEPKICYLRHERNQGCSAAYNTGIAAATGQLIGFLDSDDVWKPEYLERQADFLRRHPEADAVFSDTEIHGETTDPSLIGHMKVFPKLLQANAEAEEFIFTGRQIYMCLLEEVPIKPSALIVKRDILNDSGVFNEAWPSGTDWDLLLRLSRWACFGYINQPLVIQRRTADATHQKFQEQDKRFLLNVFLNEKRRLREDHEALRAVNRGISGHCSNLGFLYLHSGRRRESMAVYFRGFLETREPMMLLKAASALMPSGMRDTLRSAMHRAGASART